MDARLSVKVSADAKEASAAFASLAKDIKAVGTESVGVTEGVSRVDAAMAKLAKAPDTPMALARATAKVKVEIDALRAALEKTPASAEKLKSIQVALAGADSAIDRSIARAGKLREAQEEVAQKMGFTAKGAEALSGKLSSTQGIMGMLADSSSGLAQGMAKVGFVAMAVNEAWKFAKDSGAALAKQIDAWADSQDKAAKKVEDAAIAHMKFEHAMTLAKKGLVGLGGSHEEFMKRYDEYIAKHGPGVKATEAQTKAFKEQKQALDDLGKQMAASGKTVSFTINAPKTEDLLPMDVATKYAERLNDVLSKAFKEGGAKERQEWYVANEEMIGKVIAAYEKFGEKVPAQIAAAYDQILADRGAERVAEEAIKWIDAQVTAYDELSAATERRRAKEAAAANITSPVVGEFQRVHDAAVGAAAAAGKYGTDLDQVAKSVVAAGGTLSAGAQIWLEVAMATDEATAALYRNIEGHRALSDAQKESLDAVRGWTDYVIALKQGYDDGVTSLGSYIQQLIAFKSQLSQMFAGATGDAKASLDEIIALIETLVQTAGGRDPGTGNFALDALNRAVAAGKKGK